MSEYGFPPEGWRITEENYRSEDLGKNSSIFFTGNGYLGFRGAFEEISGRNRDSDKGIFINGFYETGPQKYGESAYGFPQERQAMLNLPDMTEITIYLDDERFSLDDGRIIEYRRFLDMKEGRLCRNLYWESPKGRRMRLSLERCVSFSRRHLSVISCRISDVSGAETVRLVSSCYSDVVQHSTDKSDPRTGAGFEHNPLGCIGRKTEGERAYILQRTVNSNLLLAAGMSGKTAGGLCFQSSEISGEQINMTYAGDVSSGEVFEFEKYIAFYTSNEEDSTLIEELVLEVLKRAEQDGAGTVFDEQRNHLEQFWHVADVEINGEVYQQQGIRYNIFSLYQSAGRDGKRNVAAKGLSGEGYEGHYFWDTEIYVIPFFAYTFPDIARKLLEYRYNILEQARARARVMNEKGALFPWRTINGNEASAYFPAGTAQYHINADISYGIEKYTAVSGDQAFLKDCGAEILVETARLWISLGYFSEDDGSFRINSVTGPDEYTAIVNNNFFTNIMAANNLDYTASIIDVLRTDDPSWYKAFAKKLRLKDEEPSSWRYAAEKVYLPYDEELAVHSQDDSFMQKERWDFAGTPAERYPLLLHYHPLVIYRHQVLKQPDVVLANFLLGERFSRIEKMRDYDFYNPLTTGDSSLSPCIQSIMAAELGKLSEAYEYFSKTVRMDLDDINSNVADGVHIAAMGGSWLSIIYGFAGVRVHAGGLVFDPKIPAAWDGLRFRLKFRGAVLRVEIDHDRSVYTLEAGESFVLSHRNTEIKVENGKPVVCGNRPELRAVIFDLDGVITDSSEYHYLAWQKLADENGFTFSRQINERLRGIGRLESLDIILEVSGVNLDIGMRQELAGRKNEYYKELVSQMTPMNILPGIKKFLSDLGASGVKTALASASRNAPEVIKNLGLADSFDILIDAGKLEKGKPDPEIFVKAAEALGISIVDCVGVEDAEAGIEALTSAGIFSVGIGSAASSADWPLSGTDDLEFTRLKQVFERR